MWPACMPAVFFAILQLGGEPQHASTHAKEEFLLLIQITGQVLIY